MRIAGLGDESLWGENPPRVHLVGTVVQLAHNKTWQQIMFDDGTGVVELRYFHDTPVCQIGDLVRIIGRPAIYGGTRYLSADIIKKINDPTWLKIWQLEVEAPAAPTPPPADPRDVIVQVIRQLDEGSGADILSVIEKSGLPEAETLIEKLKTSGEIFETRPGKVKVLE